ncbi:MAG: GntR family transcriptional regulator [Rhodanobacter sp.]
MRFIAHLGDNELAELLTDGQFSSAANPRGRPCAMEQMSFPYDLRQGNYVLQLKRVIEAWPSRSFNRQPGRHESVRDRYSPKESTHGETHGRAQPAHQLIHELRRLIVSGELKPGDGLPREELLAERMNVSRTALREAMKVLSAKGLIQSRQKTGTRVRDTIYWNQLDADVLAWRCASMPTDDFVEKLVEMREVIEPAAGAAAARRRTAEQQ